MTQVLDEDQTKKHMRSCDWARLVWFCRTPKTEDTVEPHEVGFNALREIREAVRDELGGGSHALAVAFQIEQYYGWPHVSGVYLSEDGEPIALHTWNVLPDGSVLDACLDQFGEERDVRLTVPGESSWRRYRLEWTSAYNPSTDTPELTGCLWNGRPDLDVIHERRRESPGQAWWIPGGTSPTLEAYRERQAGYTPTSEPHALEDQDEEDVLMSPAMGGLR